MEILLQRETLTDISSIGILFINEHYGFLTLEDKMREVYGKPVSEWKIKGQTAIPVGKYQVILAPSPKRGGRIMPLLLNVPGFVGIQIHSGNDAEDTEGCILVGTWKEKDAIRGSKLAYDALLPQIQRAIADGEAVTIEVKNPAIPAPLPVDGIDL